MTRLIKVLLILAVIGTAFSLTGCSTTDSDADYGEAYDADYMMTDYVDQLLRDGAQIVVGNVEITGSGDDYTVTVAEKKVVSNENYKDGYYIADKNITSTYPLGSDMGILVKDGDDIKVCTAEEFVQNYSGDSDALYNVYLIGDVVELIQPLDPEAASQSDK